MRRSGMRWLAVAGGGLLLVVVAATAAIAGGGLFSGEVTYDDVSASAYFGGKGSPSALSVSVSRSTFVFEPEDAPATERDATVMFLSYFSGGSGWTGCFVVPDSAFAVAPGLGTANLDATVTAADRCPGGPPKGRGPDSSPAILGGPPAGTPPFPLTVQVAWTGSGVIANANHEDGFQCLGHQRQNQSSSRATLAAATASVSAAPGAMSTTQSSIRASRGQSQSSGTLQPACFG